MRRRMVSIGLSLLLLSLIVACGGDSAPAAIPASGATVCEGLKKAERFRYVFTNSIESPRQPNPDESVQSEFVNQPGSPDFKLSLQYKGVFVAPQSLDYETSVLEQAGQSPLHKIRIGENEWVFLSGSWQGVKSPQPFPFAPLNVCDLVVSPLDLSGQAGESDSVGDTSARRIHLSQASLDVSSQLWSPASDMGRLLKSFDVDVWLSEEKARLLKVEAVSKANYPFGRELSMRIVLEIGPYNEKGLEIEPPI